MGARHRFVAASAVVAAVVAAAAVTVVAVVVAVVVGSRLSRVLGNRSRNEGGGGPGLAIAPDAVRRHGGTLTTTEARTGGAVFHATLPAAPPYSRARTSPNAPPPVPGLPTP